ncbi:hypothetical protein SH203_02858 [Brevundimonas sp. SH203]|uniref:helix-turn-helix domain-containing protein n=1 Tax=Brevundimonas sp. SH203 TaxID=345167 RepID=UPI0009CA9FE3|nr:helix-turn-helix domain-containing protein [Brevundimonas sp. SH203]GAW42442.1 hypothetical protein SH203_02858 [Brevundimonas sp. SH203]
MAGGLDTIGNREPGLMRALKAARGVRALARKLSIAPQSVSGWPRVPRDRVFEVARVTGLAPVEIRPDLADWLKAEQERGWMERARAKFAIRNDLVGRATVKSARDVDRPDGRTMDLLDLGLITAAVRFAAGERGLTLGMVMNAPRGGAGGAPTPAQSARSYAMSLAVVVGRVNAETVAGLFGLTRQAVDNAAERYLRAREGDEDAEDGKVIERGRERRAKAADPALWAAERRFIAQLAGEA